MRLEQLICSWVQNTPTQLAVDGRDERLSYAELDAMANRFAHLFLAQGIRPGDRVGVHLPRGGRSVAAIIGALRVGAVYVPLDPSSPPPRIRLIATDCDLRHVVISPPLLASWVGSEVCEPVEHFYLCANAEPIRAPSAPLSARIHSWAEIEQADSSDVAPVTGSIDDLAYLLYTSGSTGVPKGVMLSHRNALAFVDWAASCINLSEADRVASVAPFHFDLSVFDLWASLARGATMVIVDEVTVTSGRRMLDRIHEKQITVWYSVPSALVLMLESGQLEARGATSLRVVYFAGEVFPMKHLIRTMKALPKARFYNLFGPTETNVCLAYEVQTPPSEDATAIPIGRASCGDIISIVDAQGMAVPDGEVGELLVDGPTVMLGYWDGGQRTPARHPYATGDLVSRRADGELMYHGRRDHLVKIYGFRVELGEVEAALYEHPAVREAVAMAISQQLVVAVVLSDSRVSVLDLKRHCVSRLPRYMVPNEVRVVEALPRTTSGKTERVRTRTALIEGDDSAFNATPIPDMRKEHNDAQCDDDHSRLHH